MFRKRRKGRASLKLALARAYEQRVSTKKTYKLTEELYGKEVSSTQVSRFAAILDKEAKKFKKRPLAAYTYVNLHA